MPGTFVIIVLTRTPADRGGALDEFKGEWSLAGPETDDSILIDLSVPKQQKAQLLLIHGDNELGKMAPKDLGKYIRKLATQHGVRGAANIRIYLHALRSVNDVAAGFRIEAGHVRQYSGRGGEATPLLLAMLRNDALLPGEIVTRIEALVDQRVLGRHVLHEVQGLLLRLWLDAAVLNSQDESVLAAATAAFSLTWEELQKQFGAACWKAAVWRKHRPLTVAELGRLSCENFWKDPHRVENLKNGVTEMEVLEKDLAKLAARIDDLLETSSEVSSM